MRCIWDNGKCPEWFCKDREIKSNYAQILHSRPVNGAHEFNKQVMRNSSNGDGLARFDMALLDGLPRHSFATSTIWTEGVNTYEGVLLTDLLAAVGATGTNILAKALNDYEITFPVAEATVEGPLLAYRTNGEPMSVREKGPIWVIFPFDAVEAFRTEQTYARSIWQLDRIAVTD